MKVPILDLILDGDLIHNLGSDLYCPSDIDLDHILGFCEIKMPPGVFPCVCGRRGGGRGVGGGGFGDDPMYFLHTVYFLTKEKSQRLQLIFVALPLAVARQKVSLATN